MLRMTLRVNGKPDYTLVLPADEEYLDAVKAYDNAIFRLATAQETEPEDYIGEDGLLYCGKCRQPKEAYFPEGKTLFGRDRHPRACDCKRKILDEQQAAEDICLLRYLPHYYNGGTAAIWQTAGKLFQKKNAMNHLFIAFLIPYSIFSLVVRPCVQQRLRGCCEDFDFSVRQLIQQRFKLHPLRGLALHSFTMKNLIHRDMIAGHQF